MPSHQIRVGENGALIRERAAAYMGMSTKMQNYSIEHRRKAIDDYAASHGISRLHGQMGRALCMAAATRELKTCLAFRKKCGFARPSIAIDGLANKKFPSALAIAKSPRSAAPSLAT